MTAFRRAAGLVLGGALLPSCSPDGDARDSYAPTSGEEAALSDATEMLDERREDVDESAADGNQ